MYTAALSLAILALHVDIRRWGRDTASTTSTSPLTRSEPRFIPLKHHFFTPGDPWSLFYKTSQLLATFSVLFLSVQNDGGTPWTIALLL